MSVIKDFDYPEAGGGFFEVFVEVEGGASIARHRCAHRTANCTCYAQ